MRRREFITLLGGAAAWPLAARAQQGERVRRIGVLIGVSGPDGQARAAALVQGLAALNWHEGSNLQIEWRWAGGDTALYERYAAELVSLHSDVLLAQGSLPITLLRRHTGTYPDRVSRLSPIPSDKASSRTWYALAATSPGSAALIHRPRAALASNLSTTHGQIPRLLTAA